MHVLQTQLVNYSYNSHTQKHIKLVRWWILNKKETGEEEALPFTDTQEDIFIKFMESHPANFPTGKKEVFDSQNLTPPILDNTDRDTDVEKPCILLVRAKPESRQNGLCRRMDIVFQNEALPISLPFDLAGEIILEKAK
jgi:hypothetical protein